MNTAVVDSFCFQVHYQLDVLFARDFFSLKGTIREREKGLLNKLLHPTVKLSVISPGDKATVGWLQTPL